jgi:hypothetical protein
MRFFDDPKDEIDFLREVTDSVLLVQQSTRELFHHTVEARIRAIEGEGGGGRADL